MPDGTVRGRFDLDAGPAIRAVREYRREAVTADAATKSLGSSIDDAFGTTERERIKSVTGATRSFGTQTTQTRTKVNSNFASMRRQVERDSAKMVVAIEAVETRLHALGREHATAVVDVDGVARAIAQVELLHSRLQALGRERTTARVGIGGGFASGAGRAMAGGGGGRGVFGYSGSGGSGISFGPLRGRTLVGAAALGLPALQSLSGAAVGLAGSLTGATLGAGAVGLAGGGALAAGVLSVVSVAKPSIRVMQDARRAQQRYTEAVRQYGATSREARAAHAEFDRAVSKQPGLRRALAETRAFAREWKTLTAPGRAAFFGGVADVTRIGRRAAPNLARNANLATGAVRNAAVSQARFLTGSEMQQGLDIFTREFVRDMPIAERSLRNVESTFVHIARAATPFFHDGVVWMEHWTAGWDRSTSDIYGTRREIGHMVQEFKDWRDLSGAVFHTVRDIFKASSGSGDSMVRDLTRTFDRWDAWVNSHPEQTREFFEDTAASTEKIASGLGSVVRYLNQMATLLRPLADRFAQLVTVASSLGLLGAPGIGAAVYGGFRGLRGGMGGSRLGGGVALGGGATGVRSAAGLGMGATPIGMANAAYLAPRGAEVGAVPGMLGLTPLALSMMYRRPQVGPIGTREFAARPGTLATPEAFAQRYGGVAGARYAGPISTAGTRAYGLGRVRNAAGPAMGALRGAARGYLPIAAAFGALDAATFSGSGADPLGDRARAFFSTVTAGALPAPLTAAQKDDKATQDVQAFLQDRVNQRQLGSIRGSRLATATINRRILSEMQGGINSRWIKPSGGLLGRGGFLGTGIAAGFGHGVPITRATAQAISEDPNRLRSELRTLGETDPERAKRIRLLIDERDAIRQTNAEMRRQRQIAANARARRQGFAYGSTLGGAYDVYRSTGMGVQQAAHETIGQAVGKLGDIRKGGVEALGEASLAWAREMARRNPALRGEVERLTRAIEARFRRMGRTVAIVNGQILTGSRTEWRGIRDAMTTPAEQAREKVMDDFTAIQQQAVGSLTSMGFSAGDARKLVQAMENGGAAGRAAQQITSMTAAGIKGPVRNEGLVYGGGGRKNARGGLTSGGGIIGGKGLSDTVPVPGGLAAPGEAWIANRHTLADISLATREKFGLTAQQMIRGERRRHSDRARFAYGGVTAPLANLITRLDRMGFHHGSTTGGGHVTGSYHYSGMAVDYGDASNDMQRLWSVVYPQRRRFAELFGPSRVSPKPTLMHFGAGFSDAALQADHEDHIHMGLTGGGGALGKLGMGAGGIGRVRLHGVGLRQAGIPGLLRARAGDIHAKGLERKINKALSSMGGIVGGGAISGGGTPSANQRLGRSMMLRAGYSAGEWPSLQELWRRESGWDNMARNPTSGAFGIPQALPPTKMPPAAQRGNAGSQIGWGLGYIRGRYGTPTSALAFHNSHNWYNRGGEVKWGGAFDRGGSVIADGPTLFMAGEGPRHRREIVNVTPMGRGAGRGAQSITIGAIHVTVKAGGDVSKLSRRDLRRIGEEVVGGIVEAMKNGDVGVVD